jgi:hypothetical protein
LPPPGPDVANAEPLDARGAWAVLLAQVEAGAGADAVRPRATADAAEMLTSTVLFRRRVPAGRWSSPISAESDGRIATDPGNRPTSPARRTSTTSTMRRWPALSSSAPARCATTIRG